MEALTLTLTLTLALALALTLTLVLVLALTPTLPRPPPRRAPSRRGGTGRVARHRTRAGAAARDGRGATARTALR